MSQNSFICDYCGQVERGKGYLSRHIETKHRKFFCDVCLKFYLKKSNFLRHLRAHFEKFICQYCGVEIHRLEQFQKHVNQQHEKHNQLPYSYECRHCIRTFPNAIQRNSHQTNIHKGRQEEAFKCQVCKQVFVTKENLRSHSFEHYTGTLHFCAFPSCDRFFKTKKQQKDHMLIHGLPRYQCNKCPQRFFQSSNCSKHKKRCRGIIETVSNFHSKEGQEEMCRIAKQQFLQLGGKLNLEIKKTMKTKEDRTKTSNKNLEMKVETDSAIEYLEEFFEEVKTELAKMEKLETDDFVDIIEEEIETNEKQGMLFDCLIYSDHMYDGPRRQLPQKTHMLDANVHTEFICDLCGAKGGNLNQLVRHMKQHRTPDVCGICNLGFRNVKKHMKEVHTLERPFVCSVCKAGFKTLNNLNNHVKTHEEPEPCPICNKVLPNMKRHLQWHNRPPPEPFECSQCRKNCSTKQSLQQHILRVHEKANLGRTYNCKICCLDFIRNKDLRHHSYIHYTGKIYHCSFIGCNEMFKQSSKRQSHLLTHNPLKSSVYCSQCDRKYRSKATLKKHLKLSHGITKEKP